MVVEGVSPGRGGDGGGGGGPGGGGGRGEGQMEKVKKEEEEEAEKGKSEEGGGQKRGISATRATVCSTSSPDRPLMPISTFQISIITRADAKMQSMCISVRMRGVRARPGMYVCI